MGSVEAKRPLGGGGGGGGVINRLLGWARGGGGYCRQQSVVQEGVVLNRLQRNCS